MSIRIKNVSALKVVYNQIDYPIVIQVISNDGVIKSEYPVLTKHSTRDGIRSVFLLKPGEVVVMDWVISAQYSFGTPGEYCIDAIMYKQNIELPEIMHSEVKLAVDEFNKNRIENRLTELFQAQQPKENKIYCPPHVNPLYFVHNDAVIPHLLWMISHYCDSDAIQSIRRLGTERAEALITDLQSRNDRVGASVRDILRRTSEISLDDCVQYAIERNN